MGTLPTSMCLERRYRLFTITGNICAGARPPGVRSMPRYPQSAVTAKTGLNHVRATVESAGSVFIKIEQDSDLGIDALIDLVQDGKPLNRQLAIQIKSGQSYYDSDGGECL